MICIIQLYFILYLNKAVKNNQKDPKVLAREAATMVQLLTKVGG